MNPTPGGSRIFAPHGALPLFISLLAFAGCSGPSDRVLAHAGGRTITAGDLTAAARQLQAVAPLDPSPEGKSSLLDQLINRALLVAEARRLGYANTPEFKMARQRAAQEILPEALYARVVGERVSVSDEETRALWSDQDEEWRLSQIFTLTRVDADNAAARLRRGEKFAEVARTSSKDRATAAVGGDIGYVTFGQIPRAIERAIRKLPVGGWTGPIAAYQGYTLVQVTDRRAHKRESFESSQTNLVGLLRQRKERSLVLDYVARLKLRVHLKQDPAGFAPVTEKWENRRTEDLIASNGDPKRLGFTDADLKKPLVTFDGGSYTVRDFFQDFLSRTTVDKAPSQDDAALRSYVEDRAMERVLAAEAVRLGLDRDPETVRQLRDREDSYLITRMYEEVVVPSAQVTPEELASLRATAGSAGIPEAQLQSALAEAQARLFQEKRMRALNDVMARLRKEHPPQIEEKALAAMPWPIPSKENS